MNLPVSVARLVATSIVASALLAACVVKPDVTSTRIGIPAAPRDPQCDLELRPSGEGLEMLGQVVVLDEERRPFHDPALLTLIKPDACELGGEVVVGSSQSYDDGPVRKSRNVYIVMRKSAAPTSPVKF